MRAPSSENNGHAVASGIKTGKHHHPKRKAGPLQLEDLVPDKLTKQIGALEVSRGPGEPAGPGTSGCGTYRETPGHRRELDLRTPGRRYHTEKTGGVWSQHYHAPVQINNHHTTTQTNEMTNTTNTTYMTVREAVDDRWTAALETLARNISLNAEDTRRAPITAWAPTSWAARGWLYVCPRGRNHPVAVVKARIRELEVLLRFARSAVLEAREILPGGMRLRNSNPAREQEQERERHPQRPSTSLGVLVEHTCEVANEMSHRQRERIEGFLRLSGGNETHSTDIQTVHDVQAELETLCVYMADEVKARAARRAALLRGLSDELDGHGGCVGRLWERVGKLDGLWVDDGVAAMLTRAEEEVLEVYDSLAKTIRESFLTGQGG